MASLSKRDNILKTATALFMQHGYRGVSMDMLAKATPVSKPTLYANFADKEALFAAVITDRCKILVGTIETSSLADPKTALTAIGTSFLTMLLDSESLGMHRVIAAEAAQFPTMAKLFYESGPKQTHLLLSRYLALKHREKVLNVEDATLSADMFLSMVKGHMHLKRMLNIGGIPSTRAIKERVSYAADIFLQGHGK